MKAVEFDAAVSPEGIIAIPEPIRSFIPLNKTVRVVLLWVEDAQEEAMWQEAAMSIFREGDGPYDALYDEL